MLKKTFSILLLAIFAFGTWGSACPASAKVSFSDEEKDFIELLNDYRKSNGKKALEVSKKLTEAAQYMSANMASTGSEIDPQNRTATERAAAYGYSGGVGENLAVGYETAQDVFDGWKGSSIHKDKMLSSGYNVVGISYTKRSDSYKWYWSCVFGDTKSKSDLVSEDDYKGTNKITVTVTDSSGVKLGKAQVKIYYKKNGKRRDLASKKANSKGKAILNYSPGKEKNVYVSASLSGYTSYARKVSVKKKTTKIWLAR